MRNLRSIIRLIAGVLFLTSFSSAQNPPQLQKPQRHRIGLALSGGGALGLAHIGVLQYFEEHHIPIDMVAGTSMGGLVGGFFATGMNSRELNGIVEQADWNVLLSPNPRFLDEPVVEKQRWNHTFGNITLRFGRRFTLPAGLNSGEALSLLLSRNTVGYEKLSTFDDLPTPFRCVATDLISAQPTVLGSGSLPKALRATMALPAVFTPVKWDNKILVDGGFVQNVPVEVVRDMGADTTIAVVLDVPPPKPEKVNSLLDVLRQMVTVAIVQNERRSERLADIVISVHTGSYREGDYARASNLIRTGYEAAKAKASELAQFEIPPQEWLRYIQAREQKRKSAPQKGRLIDVVAGKPSFQESATHELTRKLGAGEIDESHLEDVLSGMVAATDTPGASYQWEQSDKGEGYRVEFLDRPGDQLLLRPSFHYSVSGGEPSRAALRFATSIVSADSYKSRLLGEITVGYDPEGRTEFYHPFDGSRYFIAPGFLVERHHVYQYNGRGRSDFVRDRFGMTFYGGVGTWRFAQLRLGIQAGYDSYSKPISVDSVPARSHGFVNPEITWLYNTQDSGGLPNRGTRIEGAAGYSFRNLSFPYLHGDFSKFQPVSRRVSLFGLGTFASSFGTKLNYYEQFTAGGAGHLSAFPYQQFHTNSMVTVGAGVILHYPQMLLHPAIASWYEAGRLDLGSGGWKTPQSISTGVFFPTSIGAAGLALSFDEAGRARLRLSLGTVGE